MARIFRGISYYSAGKVNNKPAFHILSTYKITLELPKWFIALINNKKITVSQLEAAFREFRTKFNELDFDLVNYRLYSEQTIVVTTSIDGRPTEANAEFKAQMRLFNKLYKNFLNEFKPKVEALRGYRFNQDKNRVVCYGPVRSRAS